ncbi:MAG: cytidylate kinase-like family protein [Oscillospiraceae bacterium]|jgi:Cytidylate kinase|nr:cytidylate kinase-like family protein [Oscillospiraceae bacterium]
MIVTIGREHGSGGHDIARALAEALGYTCFDKEIVDQAAESSRFSREILDSFDEKRVSPYVVPVPNFVGMGESFRLNMQVAAAQFDAIRTLAEQGNGIFVGRCADYVLRNRPDLLRVFVQAGEESRMREMMKRRELSEEQAKKLVRQVDKDRASYYRYYTDQVWGERENYDLILNSDKVGVEGAVRIIKACIEAMESE